MLSLVGLGKARGRIVSFALGTSYGGHSTFMTQARILNTTVQGHLTPFALRTEVPTPAVQALLRRSALVSAPSCNEKKGRRWLLGMSSG